MTDRGARREIAAAVASAADAARAAAPEQMELLPPSRFSDDDHRAARLREAVARDRRGRPPGARNMATRETLDFVRKTIGDPVMERARYLLHTPETLAAELGCTKLEAFDRLDAIRSELARLYYAPLAPVDGQGNAAVPVIQIVAGASAGSAERLPWEYMAAEKIEENQALAAPAPAVSHGAVSHGEHK